ncbi:uncharacterized protein LOC132062719 [Lycium ferocissimum]|uniref:uncharacterized protein LOC132062719 n=1 Tax=Lycium ferocissimum TaxID=112874 RepID=UPI0028169240|nr:uncharacterized protein LOC132062719 [Lycium ferocissimum]
MSEHKKTLFKYKSWSPDIQREEAWLKRRNNHRMRLAADRRSMSLTAAEHRRNMTIAAAEPRRSMSVTDEDLEELRACFELGFGFDLNSDLDPKLTKAFPALELYQAVNKLSRSSSSVSMGTSECETPKSVESSVSIVEPGDDPKEVKMRLKQWAQVVALSVLPSPSVLG